MPRRIYMSYAVQLDSNSVSFVCLATWPPSTHFYQWNTGEYKGINKTFLFSSREIQVLAILKVNHSDCRNTRTFTCKFSSNYDSISSIIKRPLMVNENYESTIAPSASTILYSFHYSYFHLETNFCG